MNDRENWKQIEELFHQALDVPSPQRKQFINERCGANESLKQEVVSLLDSHAASPQFLEPTDLEDSQTLLDEALGQMVDQFVVEPKSNRQSQVVHDVEQIKSLLGAAFEFRRVIAHGGMGVVVEAYDPKLARCVAIKLIHQSKLDEKYRQRMIRESQLVARLKSDHVVTVHGIFMETSNPFIVMELIDGPSFKELLQAPGEVDFIRVANIMRDVALGLSAAHELGLVHRDVKPANILVEWLDPTVSRVAPGESAPDYRAKLIDFGLAREVSSNITLDNVLAGTPNYMSPEQLNSPNDVNQLSDIYGMGATLYVALTRNPPYRGAPHMIIRQIEMSTPTPPRALDDRIPRDLESICLKAMSHEPSRRYSSAADMARDLERFLHGEPTRARPVTRLEKLTSWFRRNPRVGILATATILLALVLTLGSLLFAILVNQKNNQIARQQQAAQKLQIQRIIDVDLNSMLVAVDSLDAPSQAVPILRQEFSDPDRHLRSRLNLALALSLLGQHETQFIVEQIQHFAETPTTCRTIVQAIAGDSQAIPILKESLAQQTDHHARAKRILLLAALGDFENWRQATENYRDPSLNTAITHALPNWYNDLNDLGRRLQQQQLDLCVDSFALGVAILDTRQITNPEIQKLDAFFRQRAEKNTSYAAVATAELAVANLQSDLPDHRPVVPHPPTDPSSPWFELPNNIRMVAIRPTTCMMGMINSTGIVQDNKAHEVTITRPFMISDTEITVAQFREFIQAVNASPKPDDPVEAKWRESIKDWKPTVRLSPTDQHPAQQLSWPDAVRFCNWLSKKHHRQPVYRRLPEPIVIPSEYDEEITTENWVVIPGANGFRLPTDAEWELACRANSETRYHYGTQSHLFEHYGIASSHTWVPTRPVRKFLPNRFGLFGLHGNVWEWCQDWFQKYDEKPLVDPQGPDKPFADTGRVHRGGGVGTVSGETNSEARGQSLPDSRYYNLGFRIACPPMPATAK